MRRSLFRTRMLAALLAVSLVAAACGGSDKKSADTSGGGTTTAAAIDPQGVLRLGTDLSIPQAGQFDPVSVDILLGPTHEYIYGTLLRLNAKGKVEPNLAKSVEIVDPSNLVVTLRSGLKFTDGTVLDAAALKFSWERVLSQGKPGGLESEFREVESLTVSEPLVMQVKLKKPIAGTFYRLMRLAESSPVSPTAVKSGVDLNKTPIGAGPFTLESHEPNVATKLKKNPMFWDAANIHLAGIEFIHVTAQALANAIRSGAIDFSILNAPQARDLAGIPGYQIENKATNGINLIGFWCKNRPPFDNLKVRQALEYAIDRDALNAAVYDGKGGEMAGFDSPVSPFYDPKLKDYYKYNPTKAKALLAEAGVTDLAFDMFFQPPGGDGQIAAEVLQQQFAKIGVKVTLKPLTNLTDFYPNATGAPINITGVPRSGIQKVTRLLVPPSFGDICNWNDPELNDMVLKLQGIDEHSAEGVALWHKLDEYALRNAVHLFGLFGTEGHAVSEKRLGGVELYEGRSGTGTLDITKVFIKK